MKQLLITALCLTLVSCSSAGTAKDDKSQANADAVESALLDRKNDFRACYEDAINSGSPDVGGRVMTAFTIEANGKVRKASIQETTLHLPATESCLLKVLREIQFPLPAKGGVTEVTYPFKFSPLK